MYQCVIYVAKITEIIALLRIGIIWNGLFFYFRRNSQCHVSLSSPFSTLSTGICMYIFEYHLNFERSIHRCLKFKSGMTIFAVQMIAVTLSWTVILTAKSPLGFYRMCLTYRMGHVLNFLKVLTRVCRYSKSKSINYLPNPALPPHTILKVKFLSKNSTLISRENCRFYLGEKLVKMFWFWTF